MFPGTDVRGGTLDGHERRPLSRMVTVVGLGREGPEQAVQAA